jgi:hypothetical protein
VGEAVVHVDDVWTVHDAVLTLTRRVRVAGSAPGGMLSSMTLVTDEALEWTDVRTFAPGMLYGS